MLPLLLAKVWHYWLSVALIIPVGLLIVGLGLLYVVKVLGVRPKS